MLREWIRNIPVSRLNEIISDSKVKGSYIWRLACLEIDRRRHAVAA